MKKFVTLLLALVMILSMATVASAATITIDPNVTGGTDTAETYKAYKIFDATYVDPLKADSPISYTIDSTTNPFYQAIVDSGYFTLDQINDTTVYNVTKKTDYDAATLATSLKDVITETTPVAGSANAANTDNKYVITVADKGYYLITSSLGSKMIVDTLGDIEIDTKNSYPSLTKTADKTTAAYGETVTFTIPVVIPATAVGAIVVHDTLDGLTYTGLAADSAAVTANNAPADNHCSVEFTISADMVAQNLGGTVTIKYTATVNDKRNEVKNDAYLTYSHFTSTHVDVTVKNYKLDVFKYTGEEKTGLAGAGFVLKNAEGKYYKYADDVITWVDAIADATEYTTAAESFTITFEGLANGTYTLVEKTVPAGYNKANDLDVEIKDADKTGDNKVEVLNQSGTELPSTGGVGTTMFYVIGGLMMLMAVVLLVTKKRMASAE